MGSEAQVSEMGFEYVKKHEMVVPTNVLSELQAKADELEKTKRELRDLRSYVDRMDSIVEEIIQWGQHSAGIASKYKEMAFRLSAEKIEEEWRNQIG